MAELITIKVASGDTFGTWVAIANNTIDRLNSISKNANTVSVDTAIADVITANTVSANTVKAVYLDAVGSVLNITADNISQGSNTTYTGSGTHTGVLNNLNSANTNFFGNHINITANTVMQGTNLVISTNGVTVTSANTNLTGGTILLDTPMNVTGLDTDASTLTGAINEAHNDAQLLAYVLG